MDNPFLQPDTIEAIIPIYTTNGDSTNIIRADGSSTTVDIHLRSAIHRLARSLVIDLTALKRTCSQATCRNILQPLPLSPGLVLFPVKARIPRVKGDNTIGYINLSSVASVTAASGQPYHAVITLTSGQEVPVIWTKATIQKQMQLARLAAAASPRSRLAARIQEDPLAYGSEIANILRKFADPHTDVMLVVLRASR